MPREVGLLLLPLLLLGCGHSTHGAQPFAAAGAGQATADDGGQGGGAATPTGGAADGGHAGDATLAPAAGSPAGGSPDLGLPAPDGAAGTPDAANIRAGTRYCAESEDCFGFDCIGFTATQGMICSMACATNAGCALGELCIGVGDLPPLCLQPCQAAEDCGYAFDCVHYQDVATFCLPAPWTEHFMHPMP